MANPFLDHPNDVGETYLGHMGHAGKIGGAMILGGLACLLHGIFPFLFVTTGSNTIRQVSETCAARRALMAEAAAQRAAPEARVSRA